MPTAGPAALTARAIIEANLYMVLATADGTGRPWSSPVYFAHIDFAEFFWVSSPGVTHSRNIAVRPEVGIAVFDSQVAIGAGQGLYMPAAAKLLQDGETARGIEAFSRHSVAMAIRNGRARRSGPAPACDSIRPLPTRTGSLLRTVDPTIAFTCRSPDTAPRISTGVSSAAHAPGGRLALMRPGRRSASDFTIRSISRRISALNGPTSNQ